MSSSKWLRLVCCLTLVVSVRSGVAQEKRQSGHGIIASGKYMVRLCSEERRQVVSRHIASRHNSKQYPDFRAKISRHVTSLKRLPAFFVQKTSRAALREIEELPGVCGIDPVRKTWIFDDMATGAPSALPERVEEYAAPAGAWWHMDRTNQAHLPLDGSTLTQNLTGRGVNVFVLDTGLDTLHPEFIQDDREVRNIASYVEGERFRYWPEQHWISEPPKNMSTLLNTDKQSHGTHTTGAVGGSTLGPASQANLYHVKVLSDFGVGDSESIIEAMDDIAALVVASSTTPAQSSAMNQTDLTPALLSMSLGGFCLSSDATYCKYHDAEALAIADLAELGITTIVAAGNDGDDACFYQPAAAAAAISVAAADYTDVMAAWSNYGSCVDLTGPGVDVPLAQTHYHVSDYYFAQTYVDDDEQLIAISSGTSFSTPVTAGVFALFLERFQGNVSLAKSALLASTTRGALYLEPGLCPSNDRLLRAPFEDDFNLTEEPLTVACDEPEPRIGWPFFYDIPEYASYSYDFGCADTCYRLDNCSVILETACNGTCSEGETEIIYERICLEEEVIEISTSYSYSFDDDLLPNEVWVRPVKVPRQSLRGADLQPGACLELSIPSSEAYYYSHFAFHAAGGDFATVFVSNTTISDCAFDTSSTNQLDLPPCDAFAEGDDVLLEGEMKDPSTYTVRARLCKGENAAAGAVDLTLFAIHSLRDRVFLQDKTDAISSGTMFDLMLPSAGGNAQLSGYETGECGLFSGSSILDQDTPNYTDRTFVGLGAYLTLVGLDSPYDDVEHVRCTLLISRTTLDEENTPVPTIMPTPVSMDTFEPTYIPSTAVPVEAPTLYPESTYEPTYSPTTLPSVQIPPSLAPVSSEYPVVPTTIPLPPGPTNQPSSGGTPSPSLRPITAAPSLDLLILVTSHFEVSGTNVEDAATDADLYARAVAQVMIVEASAVHVVFESSGSRRRLLDVILRATYSITATLSDQVRLEEKCYAVTAAELNDALHDVAPTIDSSVKIISTSKEVAITIGPGSQTIAPTHRPSAAPQPKPTKLTPPPSDRNDGYDQKKKKSNGSSSSKLTVILLAIFIPILVLAAIVPVVIFYFKFKRHRNQQRYPFDILLPAMDSDMGIQLS